MANAYYDPPEKVRAWLENRRNFIGGSDAPAVCGVDRYRTPLDVYCSKVYPPDEAYETSPEAEWGLLDEPAIARKYEIETGEKLIEVDSMTHPRLTWMGASPDRRWAGGDRRLVQIKSPGDRAPGWGPAGTESIPDHVMIQVQQEMEVADCDRCDVAVRIGKTDFRIYPIRRSQVLMAPVIAIEEEFWARVVRKDPPEPDFSHPATFELIGKLNKPRDGVTITLPDEYLEWAEKLQRVRGDMKQSKALETECKARLAHGMGEASIAKVQGWTVWRTPRHRAAHTVKASDYVQTDVEPPTNGDQS